MSDKIGMVTVLPRHEDEGFFPASAPASEATRELVDAEVRRIVDECYALAVAKLTENRHRLDSLAQTLLERETLDEVDAYRAAGFDGRPPAVEHQPQAVLLRERRQEP
jgi:cell division protease FtsH